MWKVAVSSISGCSHLKSNAPCQDAHRWVAVGDRAFVAAVADGAGSAQLGHVGAWLAVKTAVRRLSTTESELLGDRTRWEHLLLDAVFETITDLVDKAERLGVEAYQLSTTLILAIADSTQVSIAHIGDGGSAVTTEQYVKALTTPNRTSYCNETTFLTSENALAELKFRTFVGRVDGVALFTDGIERLALSFPAQVAHPPFFRPLFRFVAEALPTDAQSKIGALLASPGVQARSDDDKTLFLAVWNEP